MYFRPVFCTVSSSLLGLFDRAEGGRHGGHHVLAVVEHLHAVPRVAGGVGGHEHRLDLRVLHQHLQRLVRLVAAAGLHQALAPLGDQVADGHDLDVRMVLEAERRPELAHPVADDADADLAVGDRLPRSRRRRASLPRAEGPVSPAATAVPSETRPICSRNSRRLTE